MWRHQRAQLPLIAALILVVIFVAGYTLSDDGSVQLKNHVLQLDKYGDRSAHSAGLDAEDSKISGSGASDSESSSAKETEDEDPDLDSPGVGSGKSAQDEEPKKAKQGFVSSGRDEFLMNRPDRVAAVDRLQDAQRAPDRVAVDHTLDSAIANTPVYGEGESAKGDPNVESHYSTPLTPQPAMGYKDPKPKKPAAKAEPEEPAKPGWRKVGSRPGAGQATVAQPKKPPKQKPPPIIEDSLRYTDSRVKVDYNDFSKSVMKDSMTYESNLKDAKSSVSYDKTTPPSVGCEDIVTELQNMVIETYAEELKGMRYAHIFGLLDATENKGDAVIWVAQEILLATLGITTMESCRYIDKDCDVASWRAGLVEYAPHSGIIMAGGGNFNDYFEDDHPARLKMVQEYGDRWPIRMFPQSINMTTEKWTEQTLETFGNAKNAQLAARDLPSYEWLQKAFGRDEESGGKVGDVRQTLSPDVAFMFGNRPDIRRNTEKTHDIYILARDDSEVAEGESSDVPLGVGVFDFGAEAGDVTYLKNDWRRTPTPMDGAQGPKQRNWAKAMHGFEILASAEFVITDRLHGHIMCTLMGIPHVLMDSKLKKNLFFHDTWTKDCDCVRIADNIEEAVEIAQLYFEKQTRDGKRKKKNIDVQPTQ